MTTMIGPLRRAVRIAPRSPAVRCGDHELTYEETWERVRRLHGALRQLGVREGDRIAVVSRNCHRYLELYQAVPGAGSVIVPLNQRHTEAELQYALEDSGARVLFVSPGVNYPERVVEHVFDLEDGYEELLAGAQPLDFPDELAVDTVAGLFYTGGTTGASKGVMLTHRNLIANALHFMASNAFTTDTNWLLAAPLFHAAGSIAVLATVWQGGRHVVLPAFEPRAALELIERERVTATLVVPTMLAALADEQLAHPRDVSTLKLMSHGGSPIATETVRRAHDAFPDAEMMHLYGTTETAPIATVLPHEEQFLDAPQIRSCGQPAVDVEVAIVDLLSGAEKSGGRSGRGRDPRRERDGRLLEKARRDYRGVEGRLVPDRRSRLHGRARLRVPGRPREGHDRVRRRERLQHRGRGRAVPARGGARSGGFRGPRPTLGRGGPRSRRPPGDVDEQDLLHHCRTLIADYKVPKRIELRTEPLPKSGAGKVLKRELRDPHWGDHSELVAGA